MDEGDAVTEGQVLAHAGEGLFRGQHRPATRPARPGQGQPGQDGGRQPAGGDRRRPRRMVAERRRRLPTREERRWIGRRAAAEARVRHAEDLRRCHRRPARGGGPAQLGARGAAADRAGFRDEDIEAARASLREREAAVLVAERQLADADLIAPSRGVMLTAGARGRRHRPGRRDGVRPDPHRPVWVRTYVVGARPWAASGPAWR